MKRYLYEIVIDYGMRGTLGVPVPRMPKVLARKTARKMNRDGGRRFGRIVCKKVLEYEYLTHRKHGDTTKDATPHGINDWFIYKEEEI